MDIIIGSTGNSASAGFLSAGRGTFSSPSLRVGQVLRAEIASVLSQDDVILNMNGNLVEAKTGTPLHEGESVFLKVMQYDPGSGEFRLQLVSGDPDAASNSSGPAGNASIGKALQGLAGLVSKGGDEALQKTGEFIAAYGSGPMPEQAGTLVHELISMLRDNGTEAGTKKLEALKSLFSASETLDNDKADLAAIFEKLMPEIEGLAGDSIKDAILGSGVAFETKAGELASLFPGAPGQKTSASASELKLDLKALLLLLRQAGETEDGKAAALSGLKTASSGQQVKAAEGLLRDIKLFQFISKLTGSFYTFLPVSWGELKEGEIVFKKGEGQASGQAPLYGCSIMLDIDGTGRILINILLYGRDFHVSFRIENQAFRTALHLQAGALKEGFSGSGMSLKSINVMDYPGPEDEMFKAPVLSENIGRRV